MKYLITYSGTLSDTGQHVKVCTVRECDSFDSNELDKFIEDTTRVNRFAPRTVVVEFFGRLDEKPADVRMSAESLIELQRVAMARAVRLFGEQEAEDRESARIGVDANNFADAILSGEIKIS